MCPSTNNIIVKNNKLLTYDLKLTFVGKYGVTIVL